MTRWKTPKKRPKKIAEAMAAPTKGKELSKIERGIKTRIVALIMLILAASLGLLFAQFQLAAVILWLLIVFAGGYAVFEFDLFVSKVFVVISALVVEFLVLDGVPGLLEFGTIGNVLLLIFGALDAILIYALSKL
jgi:hypothetical protein